MGSIIKPIIYEADVPLEQMKTISQTPVLACDIETTGLDWKNDTIATIQLCIPEQAIFIIKVDNSATPPTNLSKVLADGAIKKVFHHAMFDLRFIAWKWGIIPKNIRCTKVASKLLDPQMMNQHNLKTLLDRYLNVSLDKSQQKSNWISTELTREQITYAASDVAYLVPLLNKLEREIRIANLSNTLESCFDFIPTQVFLEINEYQDIFSY
jgi:ribonuclease D